MAFCWKTLDRGQKFFGTPSYESSTLAQFVPNLPTVSGFFANGVIGTLENENDNDDQQQETPQVFGSATTYALLRPKNPNRPRYVPSHNNNNNNNIECNL
mmetsp:Transcript_24164/g.36738  ORF Transcript_24164/g.36738 Transcript_24164/m.36738 type:complete len:100 (-) Transcript_24164:239-538(-)